MLDATKRSLPSGSRASTSRAIRPSNGASCRSRKSSRARRATRSAFDPAVAPRRCAARLESRAPARAQQRIRVRDDQLRVGAASDRATPRSGPPGSPGAVARAGWQVVCSSASRRAAPRARASVCPSGRGSAAGRHRWRSRVESVRTPESGSASNGHPDASRSPATASAVASVPQPATTKPFGVAAHPLAASASMVCSSAITGRDRPRSTDHPRSTSGRIHEWRARRDQWLSEREVEMHRADRRRRSSWPPRGPRAIATPVLRPGDPRAGPHRGRGEGCRRTAAPDQWSARHRPRAAPEGGPRCRPAVGRGRDGPRAPPGGTPPPRCPRCTARPRALRWPDRRRARRSSPNARPGSRARGGGAARRAPGPGAPIGTRARRPHGRCRRGPIRRPACARTQWMRPGSRETPRVQMRLVPGFSQTAAAWDEVRAALPDEIDDDPARRARRSGLRGYGRGPRGGRRTRNLRRLLDGRPPLPAARARPSRDGRRARARERHAGDRRRRPARGARRRADEDLAREVERDGAVAFLDRWVRQSMFAGVPEAVGRSARLRRAATSRDSLTSCARWARGAKHRCGTGSTGSSSRWP